MDWYAYGARYYDPGIGRWNAVDALAEIMPAWSPYKYGMDNPVLYTDPDGNCEICGTIIGAVDNIFGTNVRGSVSYANVIDQEAFNRGATKADYVFLVGGTLMQVDGAGKVAAGVSLATAALAEPTPIGEGVGGAIALTGAVEAGTGTWFQHNALKNLKDDGIVRAEDDGKIYEVPGDGTSSGKPYIGRTKQESPAKRGQGANDGRDRSKAKVIDTYDPSKKGQGAYKEQKAIDAKGGVDNLDNRRNERTPEKMKELEKKYGNGL